VLDDHLAVYRDAIAGILSMWQRLSGAQEIFGKRILESSS
jgi:hypothetical protein